MTGEANGSTARPFGKSSTLKVSARLSSPKSDRRAQGSPLAAHHPWANEAKSNLNPPKGGCGTEVPKNQAAGISGKWDGCHIVRLFHDGVAQSLSSNSVYRSETRAVRWKVYVVGLACPPFDSNEAGGNSGEQFLLLLFF